MNRIDKLSTLRLNVYTSLYNTKVLSSIDYEATYMYRASASCSYLFAIVVGLV